MLWLVIGVFGGPVVLGLLFLMRGVGYSSIETSYDIYAPSLRGSCHFSDRFDALLVLFFSERF